MGDYRREWAQEELLKGKRSDRDQVVWLLEWLKEKLKVAKAYYNADPNRQLIQLGMPSGIATEFKNKNQTAKGGSNSGAAKGATSDKPKLTVTIVRWIVFNNRGLCCRTFRDRQCVRKGEGLPLWSTRCRERTWSPVKSWKRKTATELWHPFRWTFFGRK